MANGWVTFAGHSLTPLSDLVVVVVVVVVRVVVVVVVVVGVESYGKEGMYIL